MKRVYRCKNPMCQVKTPPKEMFCSYECFDADRKRQHSNPEPTYVPLRIHTGRPAFNPKHGIDRRD